MDEDPRKYLTDQSGVNARLGGLAFQFIERISPDVDGSGEPEELNPANNFDNSRGLKRHKYGKLPHCHFAITRSEITDEVGVYAFVAPSGSILYVGSATTSLGKRINAGYGQISPANCYSGGQQTNCRVNNLILEATKAGRTTDLWFHSTQTAREAEKSEDQLLGNLDTEWNLK